MTSEIQAELDAEEYDERLQDLAEEVLAMMVEEDVRTRDAYEAFDYTYGGFHEEHPVSVLEHADVDANDEFASQYAQDATDPVSILKIRAHAVLAKEVANLFDDLIDEGEVATYDPDADEVVLTDAGRARL